MLDFRPERDSADVDIPTLVLAGSTNRMTTQASVRAVMRRATPPAVELRIMEGAGEMVFHENPVAAMHLLRPWLKRHLAPGDATPVR